VALTAYPRVEDRAQALVAGYDMHVPKPVDPGEVATVVAGLIGRAEGSPR
jgi:CheY-like chemotaxis protein